MTAVTLTYPPSINSIYRVVARKSKVRMTRAAIKWKEAAGWAYKAAGGSLHHGPVAIELELYPPAIGTKQDIDNCLKALLDSMNGVAWDDDSQIVLMQVVRLWPDGLGRAVLRVRKIPRG